MPRTTTATRRACPPRLDRFRDVTECLTELPGVRGMACAVRLGEGFRALVEEMARRGIEVRDGAVVETWRERAQGAWLDASTVTGCEAGQSFVRFEREHFLEVWTDDGRTWTAVADDREVGQVVGRARAMGRALREARRAARPV